MIMILGYLLFFYLGWVGYESLKSQVLDPRKIFILPLIFVVLSIWSLIAGFQGIVDLFIWAIFILLGYLVGWGITQSWRVRADRQKKLMGLPGSPITLIFVILFFAVKFFFGYFVKENQGIFQWFNLMISSLITGIFVGQTFAIVKKFSKAKHEKLRKK